MATIRIGDGRTPSGRILDRDTEAYRMCEYEHAVEAAHRLRKENHVYVRTGNNAYEHVTLEQLKERYDNWIKWMESHGKKAE